MWALSLKSGGGLSSGWGKPDMGETRGAREDQAQAKANLDGGICLCAGMIPRGLSMGLQSSEGEKAPEQGLEARKELSWHCPSERESTGGNRGDVGPTEKWADFLP